LIGSGGRRPAGELVGGSHGLRAGLRGVWWSGAGAGAQGP